MKRDIQFDDEARSSMKAGIDKLAHAVSMTLGPRGRAVVLDSRYGTPQVTFDGVTVAKELEFENKWEDLGANFIKQAADTTNDRVGDGTTTATILAHAMIDEGEKIIREKGFNVIQLAEELKTVSTSIITMLADQAEPIEGAKKIESVATLSSKDPSVGSLIAEVMEKVGKDGVVTIDDSNTIGNSYEVVKGMRFDKGYASQYFITNTEKMESEVLAPMVLVTDMKIQSGNDMVGILEKVVQSGKKELFIVAESIEGEALSNAIVNKLRGVCNVVVVPAPGFGDNKKNILRDIAIVTGATFLTEEAGHSLVGVSTEHFGSADKVIVTKDTTTIVGGGGSKQQIATRVSQIKSEMDACEMPFEKERLRERYGRIAGGVAVIKVGAPSESAQKELKQRFDDSVCATRAAMEEGIVPGGGIALFNVYKSIAGIKMSAEVMKIMKRALLAPLRGIIMNGGYEPEDIIERLEGYGGKNSWMGFDASNGKTGDFKKLGIVDPLKVTKTAFINAISVAANYLVIGAASITIEKPNNEIHE